MERLGIPSDTSKEQRNGDIPDQCRWDKIAQDKQVFLLSLMAIVKERVKKFTQVCCTVSYMGQEQDTASRKTFLVWIDSKF